MQRLALSASPNASPRRSIYTIHHKSCDILYKKKLLSCVADGVDRHEHVSSSNIASDVYFGAQELTGKIANYYGVIYGAVVGQHLGNQFGDTVNKITLDSSVPLAWDWNANSNHSFGLALDHLSKVCRKANIWRKNRYYKQSLIPLVKFESLPAPLL